MTTDEIMRLPEALADTTSECDRAGAAVECICLPANTALRSAVDTLVAERDALMEFAQYEAQCPCCSEIIKCVRGCTFHNDCPNEADRMDAARAALKGKP